MLKESPRKGVIRFGKRGKLNPCTFHISNIKKCISDKSLVIPMKELLLDDKLNFMEEPIEIMDCEVKQLRQSRIPIVKTILLGLPEDIYAAVDSCEIAQEIWLRVQQMMKGSDIGIQEKKAKNKHFPEKIASNLKFLNNLQPEWSRHVTIFGNVFVSYWIGLVDDGGANGGNQFRQYAGQNVGYQNGYNAVQNVGNQVVQDAVQNQEDWFILLGTAQSDQGEGKLPIFRFTDLDEIEEVNANCILMANLQQALTSTKLPSMIQTDQLSVEQEGGTVDQHPATIEETRAYFESSYNNLALEVEKQICSRNFKSLAKEADESLAKHKTLELEIERLLRAVVSQDIMSIVQNPSVVDSSNLQTELDRTKERLENCDIGFFIGYTAVSPCALTEFFTSKGQRIIMEIMNVTYCELSVMALGTKQFKRPGASKARTSGTTAVLTRST
ncbi:hypothetical protein Tco_0087774 [Tanacetum coccineum]